MPSTNLHNPTGNQACFTIRLDSGWLWKQRKTAISSPLEELSLPSIQDVGVSEIITDAWFPAQAFPSEIHVELLKISQIPDPYVGFNEHKVQWIADAEWLYKCTFTLDEKDLSTATNATLDFEGLDTFADVYLNGTLLFTAENQFRSYSHHFSLDSEAPDRVLRLSNTLLLHFKSSKYIAKSEEAKYGAVRAGSVNLGDPSRVYVRKAQYDWRWDWGPELMTVGPYRPIKLSLYTCSILEVHTKASIAKAPNDTWISTLKLDVTLTGTLPPLLNLEVIMSDSQGFTLKRETIKINASEIKARTVIMEWNDLAAELWWPVGYGEQVMYRIETMLLSGEDPSLIFDRQIKQIGFRDIQLIQEPLAEPDQYGTGNTFLFQVNGVRMFIGGSNWIPADNFLTTVSEERYRAWLTLLRNGNQNMVRLWGGGVYEPDIFYDICDELGILVWQDFQFACGVYPAHEEFVSNVVIEAEQNVKRLRHHPSLALFCGNNEDYQQVLQWGGIGDLPARKIYEEVLPEIVSSLTDPPIPYHRGSPYGGKGWDTTDPTIGDIHQWNVWAGSELLYQEYGRLGGRFISEFGIPSLPSMHTVAYWAGGQDISKSSVQSKLVAQHTRAGSFARRFAILMDENLNATTDLETYLFNTQLIQAEGVGFAYQIWRRQWNGKGREYTSGAIVWQLNDCWPAASWAIADYFLRAKPVYYTIARQLAPISVGIFRHVIKNRPNDRPKQFYEFGAFQAIEATLEIWGTNSNATESQRAILELSIFDLGSMWTHTESHDVILLPNQANELMAMSCPSPPSSADQLCHPTSTVVASARLLDHETGKLLARYSDWPQPYRFLELPDPKLNIEVIKDARKDETKIVINVGRPVKGLFFSVDEPESKIIWSDNALDLVPGDEQVIFATGIGDGKIKYAHLGKEKSVIL